MAGHRPEKWATMWQGGVGPLPLGVCAAGCTSTKVSEELRLSLEKELSLEKIGRT